jgi:RimJ/RimL family protein N-acetyltransferase
MNIQLVALNTPDGQVRAEFISPLIQWYETYRHLLFDDYYPQNPADYARLMLTDLSALGPYAWMIFADGQLVGFTYLNEWYGSGKRLHSCQIHGILDPQFLRRGIGTAVGRILLSYLFEELKLFRVEGWVDPENQAMRRLCQKLGFRLEGVVRGRRLVQARPRNELVFGLIRPDYFRNKKICTPREAPITHKEIDCYEQKKEKRTESDHSGSTTTGQ